jgi:fermentation-respiration switch protein FrsA (DUF1100 family)
MLDLISIVEHSSITSVWLIEEQNGDWFLAVDYLANHGKETSRGVLHGHLGDRRIWRKLQTAVDFWRRSVPEFTDISIKLKDP